MRGFKKVPQPVPRSSAILRLKDTSNGPDLLLLLKTKLQSKSPKGPGECKNNAQSWFNR
jgi:hypothetical protein